MATTHLNYHHLQYFWAVAMDGNLTRTAQRLRLSQSALSMQIRQLEDQLGEPLFERRGRTLELTEAGRIALKYAQEIFSTGSELLATLKEGRKREHVLRIGAVATLSRNFQESFIKPLLSQPDVRLQLQSGTFDDLLGRLGNHQLDLVLSNRLVQRDEEQSWHCRRIATQGVSLVGRPRNEPLQFPRDFEGMPMVLPTTNSDVRMGFDALCERLGLRVHIVAEVDDMALMRLLAREVTAISLLPSVVVRDELQSGELQLYGAVPNLYENFYAITVERQFPHPLLKPLLERKEDEILSGA